MSLLLQGLNIEMMVILIMLKAWRKVDKVLNGWKRKSMSKNVAREKSECVQRTGIVSKIFLYSWCSSAQLLPSKQSRLLWCHQWATALLAEITVYYNSKKYLITHKQLLILHWKHTDHFVMMIWLHCGPKTTLWFVAKQPNLTKNVVTIHVLSRDIWLLGTFLNSWFYIYF